MCLELATSPYRVVKRKLRELKSMTKNQSDDETNDYERCYSRDEDALTMEDTFGWITGVRSRPFPLRYSATALGLVLEKVPLPCVVAFVESPWVLYAFAKYPHSDIGSARLNKKNVETAVSIFRHGKMKQLHPNYNRLLSCVAAPDWRDNTDDPVFSTGDHLADFMLRCDAFATLHPTATAMGLDRANETLRIRLYLGALEVIFRALRLHCPYKPSQLGYKLAASVIFDLALKKWKRDHFVGGVIEPAAVLDPREMYCGLKTSELRLDEQETNYFDQFLKDLDIGTSPDLGLDRKNNKSPIYAQYDYDPRFEFPKQDKHKYYDVDDAATPRPSGSGSSSKLTCSDCGEDRKVHVSFCVYHVPIIQIPTPPKR